MTKPVIAGLKKEKAPPEKAGILILKIPERRKGIILGYAKFTHAPKVTKSNNLIIFFSDNKIVGFYGKTEVLPEAVPINKEEAYNLKASKHYSVALNKIDKVKEKGYLEEKNELG